jgi:hypothetical protein
VDIYFVLLYLCIIISDRRIVCGVGASNPDIINGSIISEETSLIAHFIIGAGISGTLFIFGSRTARQHCVSDRRELSSL